MYIKRKLNVAITCLHNRRLVRVVSVSDSRVFRISENRDMKGENVLVPPSIRIWLLFSSIGQIFRVLIFCVRLKWLLRVNSPEVGCLGLDKRTKTVTTPNVNVSPTYGVIKIEEQRSISGCIIIHASVISLIIIARCSI